MTFVIPHSSVIGPERLRTLLVLRRPAGNGSEIFTVRRFYVKLRTMVDCFQGRALLLSLSELSGPGLESGFFVTSDSPGLLALFWDLRCSPARQLVLVWWGDFWLHRVYNKL